jgi:NAD(P)-dependent dehydrogenase (short-subunit alcohol dehydrogenase family)
VTVVHLENKVAIITGGTGGLGKVVTRAFLEAGAHVVVIYSTETHLRDLLDQLGGSHERLTTFGADITREAQVKEVIQQTFDKYGRIDILVNLVGGYIGDIPVAQMEETTWDHIMNVNLKSTFLCCKAALTHMLDQETGKIINIGARGAIKLFPGSAAYAVSKAGVHTLTQAIAEEVRGKNINVNAVLPSIIDTEANRQAMPKADFSKWVKPEDLARVILFLASEEAKDIHGALIPVYGKG